MEFWNYQPQDWRSELTKLQDSYQIKNVEVELGNQIINLVKVNNIDDLLERANDPDEIPFWAELWPASIGLARFIFQNNNQFKAKRVLELGAGVGLAGIAAKLAGYQVVQSDFTIEALRFVQVNCLKNQVSTANLLLADWRNFPTNNGNYDLIIGADILYEKNFHGYLKNIFKEAISAKGKVILADPGRNYAKDFIRELVMEGWLVNQLQQQVFYEERYYMIDIYLLSSPGTG